MRSLLVSLILMISGLAAAFFFVTPVDRMQHRCDRCRQVRIHDCGAVLDPWFHIAMVNSPSEMTFLIEGLEAHLAPYSESLFAGTRPQTLTDLENLEVNFATESIVLFRDSFTAGASISYDDPLLRDGVIEFTRRYQSPARGRSHHAVMCHVMVAFVIPRFGVDEVVVLNDGVVAERFRIPEVSAIAMSAEEQP